MLGELLFAKHLDAQAAASRNAFGLSREVGRRQIGGRGIDQVSHQGDRLGDDPRPLDCVGGTVVLGQDHQFQCLALPARAVPGEFITPEQRAERYVGDLRAFAGRKRQTDPLRPVALRATATPTASAACAACQRADRGSGRAP